MVKLALHRTEDIEHGDAAVLEASPEADERLRILQPLDRDVDAG